MANQNNILKSEIRLKYLAGSSVAEIIKMFPKIKASTLYSWIKKDNWDAAKDERINAYNTAPEALLQALSDMVKGLPSLLDDPKAVAKSADSISKIVKSIKTLSKDKDRLSSIIFTISEFSKYINESKHSNLFTEEFRNSLDKILEGFQNKMLEKYSPKNFQ